MLEKARLWSLGVKAHYCNSKNQKSPGHSCRGESWTRHWNCPQKWSATNSTVVICRKTHIKKRYMAELGKSTWGWYNDLAGHGVYFFFGLFFSAFPTPKQVSKRWKYFHSRIFIISTFFQCRSNLYAWTKRVTWILCWRHWRDWPNLVLIRGDEQLAHPSCRPKIPPPNENDSQAYPNFFIWQIVRRIRFEIAGIPNSLLATDVQTA